MPHRKLNVPERGMLDAYEGKLAEHGFVADAAQWAAAECLQALYARLLHFKAARGSAVKRLLTRPAPPRGVYFWGGVGRGKSFLMDCFFAAVPYRRKKRIHFHAFMQRVHRDLTRLKGEADPLGKVAANIARETRLLCFDEFHVSDIADAMLLARLLSGLAAEGVVLVMTSNYPPDGLYPNGLHRESFLPAIDLIQRQMTVVRVDAGVDYRLRALEQAEVYQFPADAAAEARMGDYFRQMAGEEGKAGEYIEVLGRQIPTVRASFRQQENEGEKAGGVLWFDFASLCGGPRSQNDYLEIARFCRCVLLSGVPMMSRYQSAEARRFTWLVDVLYENRVKLILTADCAAEELYREGAGAHEFQRAVSRLAEMRSRDWGRYGQETDDRGQSGCFLPSA
ncbi:MAG: AFG1 family ATPase [Zoogloeaceae bacterium]|nr:AFG1 family ATPase [Zoogloeaceae bacterium]